MANRVLKFRAWDGTKMVYADMQDLQDNMGSSAAGDWSLEEQVGDELAIFSKQKNIMQFTGLNDKAGKEIYEGDVVKRYNITKVVKWHEGYAYCGWNIGKGYNYKSQNTVEVIGNIYQNPELLTNK